MENKVSDRIKGYCCKVTQKQWREVASVAESLGIGVHKADMDLFAERENFAGLHVDDIFLMLAGVVGAWEKEVPFPEFLSRLKGTYLDRDAIMEEAKRRYLPGSRVKCLGLGQSISRGEFSCDTGTEDLFIKGTTTLVFMDLGLDGGPKWAEIVTDQDLKEGDFVTFRINGKDVGYKVAPNHLKIHTGGKNSEVFDRLGLSREGKMTLAVSAYGYPISVEHGRHDWPESKSGDMAALTRLVNLLHLMCKEQDAKKFAKDGMWMTDGLKSAIESISDRYWRIMFGMPNDEDRKWMEKVDQENRELEERRRSLSSHTFGKGKCPVDERIDRPVFIITNNERTLAIADGMGHAYKVYGDSYMGTECKCLPENRYDPSEYEFDKGLSGMDF